MAKNISGSLSYLGVESKTPPDFTIHTRAPLTKDYKMFDLGDIWLQKESVNIWMLTDKQAGVAMWTDISSGGSDTFESVTITSGDLTLQPINYASTLRTEATGKVVGLADPGTPGAGEGIVYHSNDTGVIKWGDFKSTGGTVTITTTATGINMEAAGGTAVVTFTADDGNSATPSGAGNVFIQGGTNLATTSTVANTVTFNLSATAGTVDYVLTSNGDAVVPTWQPVNDYAFEINEQVGTAYTLILTDRGKEVQLSNASAITLTIPTNALVDFPVGSQIILVQYGAGAVTVVPDGGVTLNSVSSKTTLYEQYSGSVLVQQAIDTWLLMGDIR